MKNLPWFRFYVEAVDDEKLRLLAFEDRWHFVALLCCKGKGLLDEDAESSLLRRKVAVKLGLSTRELDEVARRLSEVDLIDADTLQPNAWDERQLRSDSGADRQRKYRERRKKKDRNVTRNVTMTAQDTDTDTEEDKFDIRDLEAAFDLYNDAARCAGLPQAQKLTSSRQSKLKARLKDCGGLEGWLGAMSRLEDSDYCTGKVNGWKADLDFVLQEKSFTRLMEGSYDNRSAPEPSKTKRENQTNFLRSYVAGAEERELKNVTSKIHSLAFDGISDNGK